MNLEQFLVAVIAPDYSFDMEEETLRALAVAARSRLYLRMEMIQKKIDKTENQMEASLFEMEYWTFPDMIVQWKEKWPRNHWSVHYERILEALKQTSGEVLYEAEGNHQLIDPVWHQNCAGKTRMYPGSELDERKESWSCPVLHAMEAFDREAEDAFTLTVYTDRELAACLWDLEGAGTILDKTVSPADYFTEEERDERGYLTRISFGGVMICGDTAAILLKQPSSCFYIEELSGRRVAILCMGRGSGYGMSLSGASQMAREGADYREILAWYYPVSRLRILDSIE